MNLEKIKQDIEKNRKKIKKLGPGIITGGAGDDPAGIITYTIVGATTGFSQLWLLLLSTPMMIAIQDIIAKIAIVTGKSLPEITTAFYSKKLTILMICILAIANIFTIGADLNAIAEILHIISGYSAIYFLIPITGIITYLITFEKYKKIKKILIFLTAVLAVYIISAVIKRPPLLEILKNTLIPNINFSSAWIIAALGMLGTTISPYMLFWQAAEEEEEKTSVTQANEVEFDTLIGMLWSNLIAYCIIITGAVILFHHNSDIHNIQSLALTLKPIAGDYAFVLFSIGIIISGFLAIPVLAGSTAYAVADTFEWREGIDYKVSDAKGFYIVFIGSLLVGDIIDLSPKISVVDALYYSQILDGMLIPLLIGIALVISHNKSIMGEFIPNKFQSFFAMFSFAVTLLLTGIMIYQWIR